MKKSLKSHFPMIRSKEEIRLIIRENVPERLNELLSLILGQQVKILQVLPNDSTRIADESSLVIMDIVVELEDHSIANVEVQKIGYKFSGQRSACYSADLLLRQYKRVRGERGRAFSYRDIQKVYTIVFFEKSPKELREDKMNCIHRFTQVSDTGVKLELLQEFCFVSLDIFRELLHNNGIRNKHGCMAHNVERVMGMFSEELRELDRNTVQLMIDEMQEEIDALKKEREEAREEREKEVSRKDEKISEQEREIAELKKKLAAYEEVPENGKR